MGDHYYSETPTSAHEARAFTIQHRGHALRFETDAGVFSKGHLDKGTELLLGALPEIFDGRALDLGCGWGAVGVCMAADWPGAEVVLTDINERAVDLARANLQRNGLDAIAVSGDGLAATEGTFSLIATNPPIRAGKAVVYRFFADSAKRLTPDGALYVVMRKQQGAESAKRYLQTLFRTVETVARGGGFHVLVATEPEALR